MAAPKYKPKELGQLYTSRKDESSQTQTLHEKKLIEALRERLNEQLKDPQKAKKAAIILESWINSKKNK